MSPAVIRPIQPADDAVMARIIREVMPEFGACGEGFAITDPEVDHLSAAYAAPRHAYFVVEQDGQVMGGGGVGPLTGAAEDVCELRKMYFLPALRGQGVGERLLRQCLQSARELGFATCYLETLTGMKAAQRLYARVGFEKIPGPLGATGHFGCDTYYALKL